ncbi:hypothetical protein Salat_2697200 [Sesamum alatum]|uniref:Uncharacterized protein n=1 Tax=Sesamum alatum TaxID=300844 RepID=A0AAE1XQ03_9LAMI|nr:hypothetical protein Salat_2697200 [Sesamum alatum]
MKDYNTVHKGPHTTTKAKRDNHLEMFTKNLLGEGERILDCSLFDYPHHNHEKNIYSEEGEIIGGEELFSVTWENGGGGNQEKKGEDSRRHLGKGNEGLGFLASGR